MAEDRVVNLKIGDLIYEQIIATGHWWIHIVIKVDEHSDLAIVRHISSSRYGLSLKVMAVRISECFVTTKLVARGLL